ANVGRPGLSRVPARRRWQCAVPTGSHCLCHRTARPCGCRRYLVPFKKEIIVSTAPFLFALSLAATEASDVTLTFDADAVGGPSGELEATIGSWRIAELAGARGLLVDGSQWRQGTPSANLADQARRLYGDRYAEFLDGVKAFAFFPLAVYKGDCSGE